MGIVTRTEVEAMLDAQGVAWTYVDEYPLDRINVVRSLANQARVEPLDQEVVERYTADVEAGDHFPPLIVHELDGEAILLGGNHRTAAFRRAGVTTHAAYIVDGLEHVLAALRYEDNRRHGLPPTTEERAMHGLHLMRTFGYSQRDAARAVGVNQPALSRLQAADDCAARARKVPGIQHLPAGIRFRLDMIRDDKVLAHVAQLSIRRQLTAGAVTRIVDSVRHLDDLDLARKVAAEVAASYHGETRTAGKPDRSDLRRLEIALSTITNLNVENVVADIHSQRQRVVVTHAITRALRKIQEIDAGIQRRAGA